MRQSFAKKVGFYFELPDEDYRAMLNGLRRAEPSADEPRVIAYLRGGAEAGVMMMVHHDPLADPAKSLGGVTLRTDGTWIWPVSLAYFVERYHLALPDDFVAHMRDEKWNPSVPTEVIVPEGHIEM